MEIKPIGPLPANLPALMSVLTASKKFGYSVRHFRRLLSSEGGKIPIHDINGKFFVLSKDVLEFFRHRRYETPGRKKYVTHARISIKPNTN